MTENKWRLLEVIVRADETKYATTILEKHRFCLLLTLSQVFFWH